MHFIVSKYSIGQTCVFSYFSRVCLLVTPWTVAARLLCPWDSPGSNTGVGCHVLLQGIFSTQELKLRLLHCRWILYTPPPGNPHAEVSPIYCGRGPPRVGYQEAEITGDHLGGWLPQMCRSIYCALFCPCHPSNHIWKVMKSIVPCLAELEETLGHIMSFEQVNQKTRDYNNHHS